MIAKLLVANRGEIARRIFRTCRRLGVATVAVYAPADADAPHVREADEAVAVSGYLAAEEVIAAAARTRADAIHPGYGFLAEHADFARRCGDAGVVFVGPPPEAIDAVGDKVAAKELAARLGVPTLDGNGFPALVKAAHGGGGRGMRIVHDERELAKAEAAAAREAEASFGSGLLFRERFIEGARHVEVQVLGDAHGNVVHLFGRDCSVQRRWQKVIEEAPVVDERLQEAAVALAREIGYVGAGTFEFLLTPDGGFFFLEANARLQVEHPVTEEVTGLDLVEQQLRIAERRELDLAPALHGHAIEARLYAESGGTILRFDLDGVRLESAVEIGSSVTGDFDPMIAKLIAHAPTREEAVRKLEGALRSLVVAGLETNRDLLLAAVTHPDFRSGDVHTQWFERLEPAPRDLRVHAAAAALAQQAARRRGQTLPSGWRNNFSQLQQATVGGHRVDYRMAPFALEVDGDPIDARLHAATGDAVELEVGGVRRRYAVTLDGDVAWVDSQVLRFEPRFADPDTLEVQGSLVAPMPGAVVRVDVAPGDDVEPGQPLLVVHAMKMEHTLTAPAAARVGEVRVAAGDQVEAGHVLVVLEHRE